MARNYKVCRKFVSEGDGGYCSVHGTRKYPEICKSFYCIRAREKLAEGSDPCGRCTLSKMREEGCCVGTDVGFGTKLIGKDQIPVFDVKGAADEVGPNRNATPEQQADFWRKRF